MRELKIEIAEALVLKPGDRVLLLLRDYSGWTRQTVEEAQGLLRERFPDVTFAFVSDVDKAIIEPGRAD